jgi:hypothetical protein
MVLAQLDKPYLNTLDVVVQATTTQMLLEMLV